MWLTGISAPVNLSRLLSRERGLNLVQKLDAYMRPSEKGKLSLIVTAELTDTSKYIVCKVEPSPDGGKLKASQTKGIIYYFQEGRSVGGKTIWELIERLG
jgi:hypothetical protein